MERLTGVVETPSAIEVVDLPLDISKMLGYPALWASEMDQLGEQLISKYQGPKLNILATGGGALLSELMTMPGSSRIVEGMQMPYGDEVQRKFLTDEVYDETLPHVSAKRAAAYYEMMNVIHPNCFNVAITAATTSSRYRRGQNHAFIALPSKEPAPKSSTLVYHLELSKLPEEEYAKLTPQQIRAVRWIEDEAISCWVLRKLLECC